MFRQVTYPGEGDEIGSSGKAQDVVFIIREKRHPVFTREARGICGTGGGKMWFSTGVQIYRWFLDAGAFGDDVSAVSALFRAVTLVTRIQDCRWSPAGLQSATSSTDPPGRRTHWLQGYVRVRCDAC